MGKFNFKNYDRKNRNYGNNDLNIDRLSRELIDTPRRSTNYGHRGMQNQAPRVGVSYSPYKFYSKDDYRLEKQKR